MVEDLDYGSKKSQLHGTTANRNPIAANRTKQPGKQKKQGCQNADFSQGNCFSHPVERKTAEIADRNRNPARDQLIAADRDHSCLRNVGQLSSC